MARGTLTIKKLSNQGSSLDLYQVHFEELDGDSYTASLSESEVEDLLYNKFRLHLGAEDLDAHIDELKRTGRTVIEDLEVEDEDLSGSGLQYLPWAG